MELLWVMFLIGLDCVLALAVPVLAIGWFLWEAGRGDQEARDAGVSEALGV